MCINTSEAADSGLFGSTEERGGGIQDKAP